MKLLVMAGDGIGEEITAATLQVLRAADGRFGLGLDFEEAEIGLKALARHGTTLPEGVLERARASDGIILGPISHLDYPPPEEGGVNISGVVRVQLDLYANVRPARTRPGLPAKGGSFDLVIMREATEGFYPDRNMFAGRAEFMTDPDTALSIRKITRKASERIARRSYELAMKRRGKVAVIHKANTFRLSDGLFLDAVRSVARDFPEVETEEVIVDAMAALLVREPERFDVICATNFHADILSDLASELSGSLGLAGSVNAGDALCCAQAQHGSAPDIAGQDRANPTSLILSAAMLLDWLAEKRALPACAEAARAIDQAIDAALARPETRTADLGGALGTRAFAERIAGALAG
ncbi:MAG: isocitrate/isopropylmalate dehydrogenase family protein [Kiloniellaceae bacterium]|nr:isocitrate/isopropylmalate dehydrogenase family protein [Kiloniellaceae bacterium]